MKSSVLVEMNVWQLARFCDSIELYCYRSGGSLDGLTRAVAEWVEINNYTRYVLDDIEETLMRMSRVPHMAEKYRNLLCAVRSVREDML